MNVPKFDTPFGNSSGDSSGYVCDGDTIEIDHNGLTITARIEHDIDHSIDDDDCHNVELCPAQSEQIRQARQAYFNGDWWYVGVCVSVAYDDMPLTGKYSHAVWGIECNYPGPNDKLDNSYLTDVANELIDEALKDAYDRLYQLKYDLRRLAPHGSCLPAGERMKTIDESIASAIDVAGIASILDSIVSKLREDSLAIQDEYPTDASNKLKLADKLCDLQIIARSIQN